MLLIQKIIVELTMYCLIKKNKKKISAITNLIDFRRLSKSELLVKDATESRTWQPSMNSLHKY